MPWLDKLDTRATHWPRPVRWSYLGVKWYLAALGGFLVVRMLLDRTGIWSIY